MKIKKDIAVSDSGFLFNPVTGESFSVNNIGAAIIGYLKQGLSSKEIPAALVKDFEVTETMAERDVQDFMNMLMHFQLMEP